MADLGYWALVLCCIVSLYAGVTSILGAHKRNDTLVESARNGALVAAVTATTASIVLLYLLLTRDLSAKYVYEHTSRYLPTQYVISAFWAGQEGSLLLWLWLVTLITVALALWKRAWGTVSAGWRPTDPRRCDIGPCGRGTSAPYVLATMALVQAFLALTLLLVSNPFETLASTPAEGRGLNPLLQNAWMIAHPPVVFVGYAAYTVPFALAIGGLISGQMGREWLRAVRSWALLAWLFLGAGILMGAHWAYQELGWGGYWGWDPVENASLVPWLTGTAVMHSLMMQRRRPSPTAWTLWLIALTFLLCFFATFVTRSGVIQSVHAFGRSPIGAYLATFIVLCLLVFLALMRLRGRELQDEHEPESLLSRQAALLLTNLLLGGTALVILIGTLSPALTEAIQGRQAALEASFYEKTVGPLAQLVIVLMGLCPWLAWGGASFARLRRELAPPALIALGTVVLLFVLGIREVVSLVAFGLCAFVLVSIVSVLYREVGRRVRSRGDRSWPAVARAVVAGQRRYGAHLVHLGIVLIAIGVVGSSIYQDEVQVALAPGEAVNLQGYTLQYLDFVATELPDQQHFTAIVEAFRGGRSVATLRPRQEFHWSVKQWVTEVAIHSTLREDLYVILGGLEPDGLASCRVLINPLVAWLWIGGTLLLSGGILAWWPSATRKGSR